MGERCGILTRQMHSIWKIPTKFPEGLAIIRERELAHEKSKYRKNIRETRSGIDNRCPPNFPLRIRNSYKKISHIRDVNNDNKIFTERLLSMPRNPHMRRSKSLSSIHNIKKKRAKERRKIEKENRVMKKRLEEARAVYDHKNFVPKH